ncbi:MAG: competence/damage-inducible protein A [Chloroflexi bacterium]|nr:competence/damage-inducible protein A [Chloroflexota bacterium]
MEIFSIGTELVIGQIQDTNSFWMAQQLTSLGARVQRITILPDDGQAITTALEHAMKRGARTVITSGGLGPTADDLTVECLSELLGVGTVVDRPTILDYLKRRDLREEELTPALVKMATVPEGSEALLNPAGWAPCIRAVRGETTFFVLPGPPPELEALFGRYLESYFSAEASGRSVVQRVYVNMWESEVSPLLIKMMDVVPGTYGKGYIALARNQERLPVDIVAHGDSAEEAREKLNRAVDLLASLVVDVGRELSF